MSEEGRPAWYDSRANKPRAAERRLYYQTNGVTSLMRPGDTLFLARRRDDQLFFIVTPEGSTIESQRAEEQTSELQSLMRISYADFCLKTKKKKYTHIADKQHKDCTRIILN